MNAMTFHPRAAELDRARVTMALIEAAEAGDADACTMALRGLSRLPAAHRATLAALSLASLDEADAALVADATFRAAGMPLGALVVPLAAARHWAGNASRTELKAVLTACYDALHPDDRAAFLRHVQGGAS